MISSTWGWATRISLRLPHIVEKLIEAVKNPRNHRYSASRGIRKLREAVAGLYARKYGVENRP